MELSAEVVASLIDHAVLAPAQGQSDLDDACRVAIEYGVASVCCKPDWLSRCAELLDGSAVLPSTVIGFPHGGHSTQAKLAETRQALADGGVELDMVVNVGRVLEESWDQVRTDIGEILAMTRSHGGQLKVIFENCYLQESHKRILCEICSELEVDFVKTSTGFGASGATLADVQLMRDACPSSIGVKAAGGIHDLGDLLAMVDAGATRIGASRTVGLIDECRRRLSDASE